MYREKLRKYLDDRGIRHTWFAKEKLGMNRAHLCTILSGREEMPKKYWNKVIKATDGYMTLEDFIEDES